MISLSSASPPQTKPGRDSRFAGRRAFDRWLESLPLANVSAAGAELLAGLQELNHSRLSSRFRLHALESLTEPCLAVVGVLDKRYQDTRFPLDERTDKIGRIALHFFRELGLGYRLAADQLAAQSVKISFLNRRAGMLCLHRALCCYEQLQYRASLLYKPLPRGSWNEIHTLYAFAEQNGAAGKAYQDALGWLKKTHRIVDVYKRILLMGLCDPSRLGQRAIQQVYRACEIWGQRCSIAGSGAVPAGQFAIRLIADDPPQLVEDEGERADLRFDLSALKRWLEELLEATPNEQTDIAFKMESHQTLILDRVLVHQLVRTWGVRISRGYQRIPAGHSIRLVLGLNGIHFMAAGEQSFSQFLEETGNDAFSHQSGSINNWVAGSEHRFRPPLHDAQVLNQSLGGYRLRLSEPEDMHLRVGELVAVSASSLSENDAVWMIGAVRWLHAVSTRELEVGVSLIGRDAQATAVLAQVPGKRIPPARGLIMKGFQADDRDQESLAVPPLSGVDLETKLLMCWRGEMRMHDAQVTLTELTDRTTEYWRFCFERSAIEVDDGADLAPLPTAFEGRSSQ